MAKIQHLICHTPISFKAVIADDGANVVVAWCDACDRVLAEDDCDGPIPFDDVPVEILASLIAGIQADRGRVQ